MSIPLRPRRSATSIPSHRAIVEAATRQALVSTVLIATLLISALGLGPLVLLHVRMRCHERTRSLARSLARSIRVREIMRPPTNQSIRRHLSDCSLTSVCPAPRVSPLATEVFSRQPEAVRCPDTHARSRIRRVLASEKRRSAVIPLQG